MQLVLNHEELVTELAKALARISDILPRTQLHLVLYPTEEMKRAVEELYAVLISFYQRALHWYQANRLKHVARALFKPFRLEFGDLVERINTQARSIESLAITMAHQEIRSIYVLVQECLSQQKAFRFEQSKVTPMITDAQQLQTQTLQLLVSMQQMLICKSAATAALANADSSSASNSQFRNITHYSANDARESNSINGCCDIFAITSSPK